MQGFRPAGAALGVATWLLASGAFAQPATLSMLLPEEGAAGLEAGGRCRCSACGRAACGASPSARSASSPKSTSSSPRRAASGRADDGEQGGQNNSLPQLMRRVDQSRVTLQQATRDVQRVTQRLPQTVRNLDEGAGGLPGLLLQTQQATRELELPLAQLRGVWLLGGSGLPAP